MTTSEIDDREPMTTLTAEISRCTLCVPHLPLGPRPLLKVSPQVRILVVGQAPGRIAHESGIPWNDPSGDRLRDWLGVTREQFYEDPTLGLMPMGFCFPGTGKGGDLPPRPECREAWHQRLLDLMPELQLTVVVGSFAQKSYLPQPSFPTVTATVQAWEQYFPRYLPLPHPSPRNNRWLKRNPWFEAEVLPVLQREVGRSMDD